MLREKTLAVLGAGMMGGAIARGLVRAGAVPAARIRLYDTETERAHRIAAEIGDGTLAVTSTEAALAGADIVLIAVKPPIVADVLRAIAPGLTPGHLVISIAAGVGLAAMEALVPPEVPIIRAMPNTPCLIGQGAAALCRGKNAGASHMAQAQALFAAVGQSVEVEEKLMDAVTGLSGSGPAYIYLIIEALIDGAVKLGMPRDKARLLAAQTVMGAAQMVLTSSDHPAQLRDNVTTPGGTTIAGLAALERGGVRIALSDAIEAAARRSKELS